MIVDMINMIGRSDGWLVDQPASLRLIIGTDF